MQLTSELRLVLRRLGRKLLRGRIDPLTQRSTLKTRLAELQEEGQIAITHGGIDCDGGRWDNRVALVPATIVAVERWLDRYRAQAEGRQWQSLERPSVTATLMADERDLAAEAFEDGHAHILFA
jgi:hypothetical protein